MMTDPSHFQLFVLMFTIQAIFGLGVGVISYFIRRSLSQVDINFHEVKVVLKERADINSRRIDVVEKGIEQIRVDRGFDREYISKNYVDKEDFIRDMRAIDAKVTEIASDVKSILARGKNDG